MNRGASTSQNLFEEPPYSAYTIRVESFEGPLDLLLHLIKKNEVEIYDIPIATITKQYLEYLGLMKELNLEIAGEFLVMASTLLQIKSRMLLPMPEEDETGMEEELDPREELIRRLIEYQKYKEAAASLQEQEILGRDVYARKLELPDDVVSKTAPEEPLELDLFELVEAFRRVLAGISPERFHEVISETVSVADQISRILDLLQERDTVEFEALFEEGPITRELAIAGFLAVLELCKLRTVKVAQITPFGSILIRRGEVIETGVVEDVVSEP